MDNTSIIGNEDDTSAELCQAREREAATQEILEVINRSRDFDAPVFEVILRKTAQLCDAPIVRLELANEARTHFRVAHAWGEEFRKREMGDEFPLEDQSIVATTIREARSFHIPDMADTDLYRECNPYHVIMVDEEGIRTYLTIPLIRGGIGIGCIVLSRREVKPFAEADINLVKTFAEQAVIAVENARQHRALQTRLQREVATGEILQVISESRDDEMPVFDVILKNACQLCDSQLAFIARVDDSGDFIVCPAHRGASREFAAALDQHHEPLATTPLASGASIREKRAVRINDIANDDLYRSGNTSRVAMVDLEGIRSLLVVPMIKGDEGIGAILLYRREVDPFSDDDAALVQTFAEQAVIAIDNVRQFRAIQSANTELQNRLAREAATSEILRVISQSRADEKPVFDTILERAAMLCDAQIARLQMANDARTTFRSVATWGGEYKVYKLGTEFPLDSPLINPTTIREARGIHVSDLRATDEYQAREPNRVIMVEQEGYRTYLTVPLISGGIGIGCIVLIRREVKPFAEADIALVETFAAQAVIAIENVRQFRALETLNAELGDRVQAQVGEIERMGRLKRFLPAAVADTVISSGSEEMLSSHRALLGVLFCDIRGFTAFCETAEPEETIEVLQTYHEEMGKLISAHGAGVDHRMGDGIMVLFNDPFPCDDPAGDAVRLALAMRGRMKELCLLWKRMGHRLGFGVGVSLGYATVGMVGFEGRFDYTASGTAINLASRLCDEAQDGEILLSPRAGMSVERNFILESRGEIGFKGIREPLEVFRVGGVVEK